MKSFKCIFSLMIFFAIILVSGCSEAREGADAIADEVTGKSQIEKKIKTEEKIKQMQKDHNKKLQDATDQIK